MNRASIIGLLVFVAAGSGSAFLHDEDPKPKKLWVFIGTYTEGGSKGIYRSEIDLATGRLTPPVLAGEAKNPSFLATHPSRKFLYAVGEVDDFEGKKTGGVSAFAIDPQSGSLTLLNEQPSGGAGPCHLIVDSKGKNVLVANYSGGSVSALPIQADGKLAAPTSTMKHHGSSINPQRQTAPHPHSIYLHPHMIYAFVPDLGLDKILVYKFDKDKALLTPVEPHEISVALAAGAGPRHLAFHPSVAVAYSINELNSTVSMFDCSSKHGKLTELQTISSLPKDFTGTNHPAEIVVHPSGKFVYASNRGHDSIAVFSTEEGGGNLTLTGHQTAGIKTPRNFNIDPTGTWMLVANQSGNDVVMFRINPKTGALEPTENRIEVSRPVCIKMMPAGS